MGQSRGPDEPNLLNPAMVHQAQSKGWHFQPHRTAARMPRAYSASISTGGLTGAEAWVSDAGLSWLLSSFAPWSLGHQHPRCASHLPVSTVGPAAFVHDVGAAAVSVSAAGEDEPVQL